MPKLKLCNVHKLTLANEGEERKPIHIPFGTWAYDDTLDQTLDREHAEKIAGDLKEMVDKGEPGIPVYQGHPDVPEYAGKYPDKGALGWVKTITVNEDGMDLDVEWDRDPGKGFGWFSPYWVGDTPTDGANGKRNCIIDGLNSIGLVNNPNIREFRLANEAGDNNNTNTQEKGNDIMDRKILIEKLGLPPEATDEQIYAAIEAGRKAESEKAEIETKRAAAEADKGKAEGDLANACQERDAAKKELENCKKQLEDAKTALANEKAQHEKTKALKTQSAVGKLELSNEQRDKSAARMQLVNEKQKAGMDYMHAWNAAKAEKPELFND
jgi:hypothetical protein